MGFDDRVEEKIMLLITFCIAGLVVLLLRVLIVFGVNITPSGATFPSLLAFVVYVIWLAYRELPKLYRRFCKWFNSIVNQ